MHTGVRHDPHPETAPAATPAPRRRAPWLAPAAVGGAVAAGTLAIAAMGPSDGGTPICMSRVLFGLDCPLCGGLRCVDRLAAGDLFAAADHNVLLAVALPVVAVLWAVWMFQSLRGRRLLLPRVPLWTLAPAGVLLVAFTVVRNLDADGVVGWLAATAS